MYDLGRQAAQRFRMWKEELPRHLYTRAGTVDFSYCISSAGREEAARLPLQPCPPGTEWGEKWAYGWFFATIVIPPSCQGQRVDLFSRVGGEQLVYVNGRAEGSIDRHHDRVTLTRQAEAGQVFHIQIESYAGHGPRLETLGPCPPERPAVPEVTGPQCRTEESFIALWNEDAYQLMLDVETLDSLQQVLPENSLRALKVAEALDRFTRIADFEAEEPERTESFRAAREALRGVLDCVNGSTAPRMWIFGQSHIDLGWLWPVAETFRKSVRTWSNQLKLMEEYPEYRFLLCEPALQEMLRKQDGEVWQRVLNAHRRGQVEAEGAFYVECDTNLPSGESLIRQLLYGRAWFRENLGVESRVAWQPDTFGFSAALPQILKKMGVPYFATEKLLRADPETERFPYQNFIWEGMDGSTVEALSFFKANGTVTPQLLHRRWYTERSQRRDIDTQLYPFGYGDGGGGAGRDMLEMVQRTKNLEGVPATHWGGLREFFEENAWQGQRNRWVGELYLSWHRGTYSVQRRQKAEMRRAEFILRDAETLLCLLPGKDPCALREELCSAWKILLLQQFHDIAGGVGIRRVHEEAREALQEILRLWQERRNAMLKEIFHLQEGPDQTLYNPLPWKRRGWITLEDGRDFYTELPPCSAASLQASVKNPAGQVRVLQGDGWFDVENESILFRLDTRGRITALKNRKTGVDFMDPGQVMNDWRLYRNVQTVYDAWEMDRDWASGLMEDAVHASVRLTRSDAVCAEFTVDYTLGQSRASQIIRLRSESPFVEFKTCIHWTERRKMLKAHFESSVLCDEAVHEIQFGFVRRPCHRSHAFAADRYEVSQHRYSALCTGSHGFALLNDGICGLSTGRGEMALTLLRSPLVPDDTCDRGDHDFTYCLMPFTGSLRDAGIVQAGYELNMPVVSLPGTCLPRKGFCLESPNLILETVKPAEDGRGVILRVYECMGERAESVLHLPFTGKILLSSMDERESTFLTEGDSVPLCLKPFEILTLRLEKTPDA